MASHPEHEAGDTGPLLASILIGTSKRGWTPLTDCEEETPSERRARERRTRVHHDPPCCIVVSATILIIVGAALLVSVIAVALVNAGSGKKAPPAAPRPAPARSGFKFWLRGRGGGAARSSATYSLLGDGAPY
ncbi:protein Mo10 [Beluga whale alphaherpesvirus 1]|uniref:Protein Mo10 n=1 Tax=Beluga whale alphaherpesvirus 1 TaxID=1434720 RepID=A0A286MMA5_9ALPH|nr:protein Mo10 [Beluga whale alphaherpesvirus 1]ASW27131.1 protein Mo10 [Beluga whale alphaherpesvirus 1]